MSFHKSTTFPWFPLFFVLSVATTCPLLAQVSRPSANLLPDPSFEEKAGDGVDGWKSRAWRGKENARWSVESPGRTGKRCLSIGSEKGADAAWTATVTVKPSSFYRLSEWIKTQDVRDAVGALLNIQNMRHVRTDAVSGTRDWTRVSTVFQSEAATEIEINCLFGGFIEHFDGQVYGGLFEPGSPLSDHQGFRKDVIEAVKELKVSVVRWPGGCFASGYHWKDGVGPNRKSTPDPVWGVVDPNTFGTDEFVEWCRLVVSKPYICTNAGNGTPEEMRHWVEYCNGTEGQYAKMRKAGRHDEPLNVRYWSIGNENWGGHEIGARTPKEWLYLTSEKLPCPLLEVPAEGQPAATEEPNQPGDAIPFRTWTETLADVR